MQKLGLLTVLQIVGVSIASAGQIDLAFNCAFHLALSVHHFTTPATAPFGNTIRVGLSRIHARRVMRFEFTDPAVPDVHKPAALAVLKGATPPPCTKDEPLDKEAENCTPDEYLVLHRASESIVYVEAHLKKDSLCGENPNPLWHTEEQQRHHRFASKKLGAIKFPNAYEFQFTRGSWSEMLEGREIRLESTVDSQPYFDKLTRILIGEGLNPSLMGQLLGRAIPISATPTVTETSPPSTALVGTLSELDFVMEFGERVFSAPAELRFETK